MDATAPDAVTRKGKIARLPRAVREQLNTRLREGESGPVVLPWLNALPDVRAILERDFVGAEISAENLSNWRTGGYAAWLRQQEQIERIGKLSDYSFRIAQASGGNLSEGAVAIAGGQIQEVLENVAALPFAVEKGDPSPNLTGLIESLVALRNTEIATGKLAVDKVKVAQKGEELAFNRQKWERQTLEMFFKFYADEQAKQIMESGAGKSVKMDELSLLMFGRNPFEKADTNQPTA